MTMNRISLTIFIAFLTILVPIFAEPHREHGAHEHGIASLDVTVDGNKVDIDLHSPAVNIIGFEHSARTAADKARQQAGLDRIRKNLSVLFQFDPSRGCKIKIKDLKIETEQHADHPGEKTGEHSELDGEFEVTCAKSPAGSKLKFAFTKIFRDFNLTKIRVQVMSDHPVSTVIENDEGSVEL